MGEKNQSWRRYGLGVAGCLMFGVAGQSQAQVNFTVPADAPDGGAGTIGILRVVPGTAVNNQDDARAALQPGIGTRTTSFAPVVNHVADGGGSGHFGGDLDNIAGDNKAALFRGNINVVTPGIYTFNVASDDGFTLAFKNGTVPFTNLYNQNGGNPGSIVTTYNGNANGALTFFGGRGTEDTGAQVNFASAGTYHFDLAFHDGCCGDSVELSAAAGAKTGFDNTFALVGGQAQSLTRRAGIVSGGFNVAAVHGNNSNSLADAITDLTFVAAGQPVPSRGGGTPVVATGNTPTINHVDPDNPNTGGHGPTQTFNGDTAGVDDNNFSFGGRATLTIPAGQGGHYTFLTYSDDSSRTRIIDNVTGKGVVLLTTTGGIAGGVDSDGDGIKDAYTNDGGCCGDILGSYNLPSGAYTIESIVNEQGGGDGLFVYGQAGDQTSFNPGMQLIGSNLNDTVIIPGGLQLVPEPGTIGLLGLAGIAALARRRRTA